MIPRDDKLVDILDRPLSIVTCSRCLGGRREQFVDHRGLIVTRTCGMCRGMGEIIVRSAAQ
jgi:DnaJ-class molecular chaperone